MESHEPTESWLETFGELISTGLDKSSEIDGNTIKLGVDRSENSKWFKSEDSKINRAMKLDWWKPNGKEFKIGWNNQDNPCNFRNMPAR